MNGNSSVRTRASPLLVHQHYYVHTPLSINHLHECLHKIETYPKSQSVLFCFFIFFFVRSAANAEAMGDAIRWFDCSMSLIFSGIFVHIPLWKWMMNLLTLVYTLHTKHQAAHDVGKCVNRYRVSRACVCVCSVLFAFVHGYASPPFIVSSSVVLNFHSMMCHRRHDFITVFICNRHIHGQRDTERAFVCWWRGDADTEIHPLYVSTSTSNF